MSNETTPSRVLREIGSRRVYPDRAQKVLAGRVEGTGGVAGVDSNAKIVGTFQPDGGAPMTGTFTGELFSGVISDRLRGLERRVRDLENALSALARAGAASTKKKSKKKTKKKAAAKKKTKKKAAKKKAGKKKAAKKKTTRRTKKKAAARKKRR